MFLSFCQSLHDIVSDRLNGVRRQCDDNIVSIVDSANIVKLRDSAYALYWRQGE